jgi:dTMP kinase
MTDLLIAFDGLDGAGLSTQASILRDYLIKKAIPVILTKEQTDGSIGGLIKSSLRDEWRTSPLALQLLFAADRAHHLASEIEPALDEGKTVICDRYILTSLAFGSLNVDIDFMKNMNSKFRAPDLNIIIDTEPGECIRRIKSSRFHLELFEDEKKLTSIRKNFLTFKNTFENTYLIDGNRSIEEVSEDIKKLVDKVL